jgi:hypothetical protein
MDFTFDIRGNLTPPQAICCSLQNFETTFVQSFEESNTRALIFENFTRYIHDFQNTIATDFCLWIDGSFVTNKINPNDLDMVILIDNEVYQKYEQLINTQFNAPNISTTYPKIDVYMLVNHPKTFILDKAYWYNMWTKTRPNRIKKTFEKGFLQIKFGLWNL